MNVLFFVRDIHAISVTFIRRQIQLVSQHHEVLVVTIDHGSDYEVDGFRCKGIPFQDSYWTNKPFRRLKEWDLYYGSFNPKFGKRLQEVVTQFKPDVIHCQFGVDALIFLDHFPNPQKIPVFIQFRGYDASTLYSKKSYKRRLKSWFSKSWIHPIYVSLNQYNRAVKENLVPDKKRILYSCTDTDFFSFFPKEKSQERGLFRFLQVGRMVEIKGHSYSLQAFKLALNRLHQEGIKSELVFAGDGPLQERLKKECKELGIDDLVKFLGNQTPLEIRDLLKGADGFLHPSTTTTDGAIEGMPNAIMESLSVGIPVIATAHSGIEELMCPEGGLFLFPERDVEKYAQVMVDLALGKLAFDPQSGRDHIVKRFSAQQHIRQLLEFYSEGMERC